MPFIRFRIDDVAGMDNFDRASLTLHPTGSRRHNQCLPRRVAMPVCPRASFKRDMACGCAGGGIRCEYIINADFSGEPFCRPGDRGVCAFAFYDQGIFFRAPAKALRKICLRWGTYSVYGGRFRLHNTHVLMRVIHKCMGRRLKSAFCTIRAGPS